MGRTRRSGRSLRFETFSEFSIELFKIKNLPEFWKVFFIAGAGLEPAASGL